MSVKDIAGGGYLGIDGARAAVGIQINTVVRMDPAAGEDHVRARQYFQVVLVEYAELEYGDQIILDHEIDPGRGACPIHAGLRCDLVISDIGRQSLIGAADNSQLLRADRRNAERIKRIAADGRSGDIDRRVYDLKGFLKLGESVFDPGLGGVECLCAQSVVAAYFQIRHGRHHVGTADQDQYGNENENDDENHALFVFMHSPACPYLFHWPVSPSQ